MTTFVYRNGKIVEKSEAQRAGAPHIISDEMDALRHMADGKHYTSKAKFRQATKDAGCVEIGSESAESLMKPRQQLPLDRRKRREDIKRAVWELQNGMAPTIKQIISGEER